MISFSPPATFSGRFYCPFCIKFGTFWHHPGLLGASVCLFAGTSSSSGFLAPSAIVGPLTLTWGFWGPPMISHEPLSALSSCSCFHLPCWMFVDCNVFRDHRGCGAQAQGSPLMLIRLPALRGPHYLNPAHAQAVLCDMQKSVDCSSPPLC